MPPPPNSDYYYYYYYCCYYYYYCKRFAKPADPWIHRVTVEQMLKPKQSQDLDPEEQVEPNKDYAEFGKKARKPDEKIKESCVEITLKCYQDSSKMTTKW